MTCGTCGTPAPVGGTYCPGCGSALGPVAPALGASPAAPPATLAPLPPPPPGRPAHAAPPPVPGWAPPPQPYGGAQPYGTPQPYGGVPAYGQPTAPPPKVSGSTNRYAAASLWCALTFFLAPITVVLAVMGLVQLGRPDNTEEGQGMAIAGLVIGVVELLLLVLIVAA